MGSAVDLLDQFVNCHLQLRCSQFQMITAGIIIVQVNHVSVSQAGQFTEEKVNEIGFFFSEHSFCW